MTHRVAIGALFGLAALAVLPRNAAAQDYPTRTVTILVPFAPGGGTDLLARAVAQKLEQRLGKPFVIENRPGAGTVDRRRRDRQGRARRLHADAGDQRHHGDELRPSSKACPTAGQGSGAGRAGRRRAVRAGGQSGSCRCTASRTW